MKALIMLAVMVMAGAASATPGGLDGSGCHHPDGGAYHCHPQKKVPRAQATREQCKAMPTDGWCTKYRKKPRKAASPAK